MLNFWISQISPEKHLKHLSLSSACEKFFPGREVGDVVSSSNKQLLEIVFRRIHFTQKEIDELSVPKETESLNIVNIYKEEATSRRRPRQRYKSHTKGEKARNKIILQSKRMWRKENGLSERGVLPKENKADLLKQQTEYVNIRLKEREMELME